MALEIGDLTSRPRCLPAYFFGLRSGPKLLT
jgi:hypothetical protein